MNIGSITLKQHKSVVAKISKYLVWLAVITIFSISIYYGDRIRDSVVRALRICATSIIPSVFPYMILCDYISHMENCSGFIGSIISRIYGIHPQGARAILLGNIFGFPIGAKGALSLYSHGIVDANECARIAGLSTNPSLSFVVFVTGVAIRGSIIEGYILYISVIFATLLTSVLFKNSNIKLPITNFISRQNYDLIKSIQSAASACLTLTACVSFFSYLIEMCDLAIRNAFFTLAVSLLLEIGNATVIISELEIPNTISLSLTALALGFSGVSVHLQIESILPPEIPRAVYYRTKAIEAIMAGAVSYLICVLCQTLSII